MTRGRVALSARTLARVARAVADAERPEEGLRALLDATRQHLGAHGSAMYLVRGDQLAPAASVNLSVSERRFSEIDLAPPGGVAFPLIFAGRVEGVLVADSASRAADEEGLAPLLDLGAVALRNARLSAERAAALERERMARAEAEALAGLLREAATQPDGFQATRRVAEEARRLVGADYSGVVRRGSDGAACWLHVDGNQTDSWRADYRLDSLLRPALEEGRTVVRIGLPDALDEAISPVHHAEGGRTVVVAPLRDRDVLVGALVLGWRREVTPEPRTVRMAETVANHAAAVLGAALEREHSVKQADELSAVLQQMADAVLVADANATVLMANAAATTLFNVDPDQIIGRPLDDLPWEVLTAQGEPLSLPERPLQRALRGEDVAAEYRVRLPDGQERWIAGRASPLRNARGEVYRALVVARDMSEHVQAEQSLHMAHARLQRLVDADIVGIAITASDGTVLEANDYYLDLLGVSRTELASGTIRWTDFTPPEHLASDQRAEEEIAARGVSTPYEKEYARRDGSRVWVLIAPALLPGPERQVSAFVLDITRQKRLEATIAARARQQAAVAALGRRALEQPNPGVLLHEVVQAVALTLRVEFSEVLEREPSGDLLLKAGVGWREGAVDTLRVRAGTESQARVVLESEDPVLVEDVQNEPRFRVAGFLREHGVISGLSVPIRGRAGSYGVLGAHSRERRTFSQDDVHFMQAVAHLLATAIERHEDEMRLRAADQRAVADYERLISRLGVLSQHLAAARDVRSVCRPLVNFVETSTGCNGLFVSRYDREQQLRYPIFVWSEGEEYEVESLPPMPMNTSPHSRAVATGEVVVSDDYQAATRGLPSVDLGQDVDPRLPRSSAAVPMLALGRVIGAFEVQSPEPAAFHESHVVSLKMAAGLAAIALENLRLRQEETELERLRAFQQREQLKDELLGVVSHEIRTPLASVVGFTELLLHRNFGEAAQREYLGIMLQEGKRLTALVNDFLDLQRMESGRMRITPASVDARALVEQALATTGPDEARPITVEAAEGLPPVLADADRLQQVLLNLLSNARKYSPRGGPVHVSLRAVGNDVEIAITDHGLGIPADALPKLFGKFFRVDNSDRREIKGTGLGLAICKHIVEAHGGRIWAESRGSGEGSTFRFTLPIVGGRAVAPTPSGPSQTKLARR